jgi:hypothetical protein
VVVMNKRNDFAALVLVLAVVLAACGSTGTGQTTGMEKDLDSIKANTAVAMPALDAAKAADCLAKGIAAEEKGQLYIAQYWYDNACYYDAGSGEAVRRRNLLFGKDNPWGVTGNNSLQIELETENRKAAAKKDADDFIRNSGLTFTINPFLQERFTIVLPWEAEVKDPKIDRQNGTVTYNFRYGAVHFRDDAYNKAARFLWRNAGRGLPASFSHYLAQVELVNGSGKVIARTPEPPARFTKFSSGDYGYLNIYQISDEDFDRYILQRFGALPQALLYENGWKLVVRSYDGWWNGTHGVNITVPIADITDTGMKARIVKVFQYTDPDDNKGVFELIKTTVVTDALRQELQPPRKFGGRWIYGN